MPRMNFWPVLGRYLKNFGFYWLNHERQIFVVQKPNLSVFGLFKVFLNDKKSVWPSRAALTTGPQNILTAKA